MLVPPQAGCHVTFKDLSFTEVVGLIVPPYSTLPLPFFFSQEFQNLNFWSFFQFLVGEVPHTP